METLGAPIGDPLPEADLYVLQGAEDEDQPAVARRLAAEGTLVRAAAAGKVDRRDRRRLRDPRDELRDTRRRDRAPGSGSSTCGRRSASTWTTASSPSPSPRFGLPALVGYEWHRGRTVLGPGAEPLAEVEIGVCNGGEPPTDGAVQGHVLGTYLHGPLLPRNPELADLLLGWALGRELEPLRSEFAELARAERIAEARDVWRRRQGLLGRLR